MAEASAEEVSNIPTATDPSSTFEPNMATATDPSGTSEPNLATATYLSGISEPNMATATYPSGTSEPNVATATYPSGTSEPNVATAAYPSGISEPENATATYPSWTAVPEKATYEQPAPPWNPQMQQPSAKRSASEMRSNLWKGQLREIIPLAISAWETVETLIPGLSIVRKLVIMALRLLAMFGTMMKQGGQKAGSLGGSLGGALGSVTNIVRALQPRASAPQPGPSGI
uniref:uncharacterized protein n=1 Tax=Myxine glutinosa TaxID=7769 RepID=UPI00358E51F9